MSAQLQLSLDETIEARFREFHANNPHVYKTLVRLAREAKARGKRKIGIGALWERMRWDIWMETIGDDEFSLNNDFRSRYSREIMANEPDLSGAFNTRCLRSL